MPNNFLRMNSLQKLGNLESEALDGDNQPAMATGPHVLNGLSVTTIALDTDSIPGVIFSIGIEWDCTGG